MKRQVLIADDHALLRDGLVAILRREKDIEVVAECTDGEDAVAQIEKLRPDVAILDIDMPRMTGVEAARQVRDLGLRTAVVILSVHREASFVRAALDAGASGYLLKEAGSRELVEAVKTAAAREMYLSPAVARTAVEALRHRPAAQEPELSPRERDVLRLLADGLSSKEIASRLDIGVRTVDTHRGAIMDKLEIRNIPGLVKYAILHHLTTL